MIRRILMPCLAITLLANAAAAETVQERSERIDEVRGVTRVSIDNRRGRIELLASRDGRLHVVAVKICNARTAAQARDYAQQTKVLAGPSGDGYAIEVQYPRRVEVRVNVFDLFRERSWREKRFWPPAEVELVVEVPASLPVRVNTASGDVDADGLAGTLQVTSASGDVAARALRGRATIETASGDIDLSNIAAAEVRSSSGDINVDSASGPLRVRSASGSQTIRAARDSLRVESASGDLLVQDAPKGIWARAASGGVAVASAAGSVSLASTSGDVQARLRGPLTSATLESVSGEVQLELVPGLSADLSLDSSSGTLDCRVRTTQQTRGRRSFEARVGQGGAPVRVHTVSGNVTVTSGGK